MINKGVCPDCGCELDKSIHSAVHEMWEVGQANSYDYDLPQWDRETLSVEVVYQGRRYKGTIPCVGEDSQ